MILLLEKLQGVENRNAHFVSSVVLYTKDGQIIQGNGQTDGVILCSEEGENGFGYDPLFFSDDLQKSFGIATAEEKNKVSHRGNALKVFYEKLKEAGYADK